MIICSLEKLPAVVTTNDYSSSYLRDSLGNPISHGDVVMTFSKIGSLVAPLSNSYRVAQGVLGVMCACIHDADRNIGAMPWIRSIKVDLRQTKINWGKYNSTLNKYPDKKEIATKQTAKLESYPFNHLRRSKVFIKLNSIDSVESNCFLGTASNMSEKELHSSIAMQVKTLLFNDISPALKEEHNVVFNKLEIKDNKITWKNGKAIAD